MRSVKELKERVERIEWANRYISTAGVVPARLAWELIREIVEREELFPSDREVENRPKP